MKISEIKTDELCDLLCEIAEPTERLGKDEEFIAKLREAAKDKDGKTNLEKVTASIGMFVPFLLKRHRDDTYTIVAAINGKTVDEIKAQSGAETIADVKNALTTDIFDIFDFFK